MTYSTAQKNAAANLLIEYLPGMHYRVARAWVTAEQGGNNNVFGVTVGGILQKYPSMRVGVRAAATRIKTLSYYSGIIASLKGGTHRQQATAICRSPWRLGPWGLRRLCGQDPYYVRIIFGQLRLVPPPKPTC